MFNSSTDRLCFLCIRKRNERLLRKLSCNISCRKTKNNPEGKESV